MPNPRLIPACAAALCLFHGGCFTDPEQEAKVQAMVAEQESASSRAKDLLLAARKAPDPESYTEILPLMQRSDLLITFDGTQMNADSATRKVLRERPALFREALVAKLDELAADLPADDTPLPMERAQEVLTYVKLLVDTAAEIRLSGGAATVPSVNVFIKAEGEQGPTQLTVGYLYPYADVQPASQVVINGETLPPLVEHLSGEIESGLATTAAARAEARAAE